MRSFSIAFLAGCFFLYFFQQLPKVEWVAIASLCLLLLFFLLKKNKIGLMCLAFVLGFNLAFFSAWGILHSSIPKSFLNKKIIATGTIVSLPKKSGHRTSFQFRIKKIDQKKLSTTVRLNWYGRMPLILVGDQWKLQVKLKSAKQHLIPGQFDYQKWLFQHHVSAIGYVIAHQKDMLLNRSKLRYPIGRLRQYLAYKINKALRGKQLAGIIVGLSVGERSGITQKQWQVFQRTGTNHLVAISGLHIGLMAGFMFFLVNFLWRRIPNLCLKIPARHAAAIGALIAAILYSLLAGLALTTQRALVMIAVFMLTLLLRRNIPIFTSLLFALLIVLIIDPLATLSAGFWLSFSAVSLITYGMSTRVHAKSIWWKWGRMQWVISLGLAPMTLVLFQQASTISFVANFIAVPWVSFFVVPWCLLGALLLLVYFPLGKLVLIVTEASLSVIWIFLSKLSGLNIALWHKFILNGWILVATILGLLLMLAPRGVPVKWLGVFFIFPILFFSSNAITRNQLWVTSLNMRHHMVSVIGTSKRTLLIDPNYNTNKKFVDKILLAIGVKKVDKVIVNVKNNENWNWNNVDFKLEKVGFGFVLHVSNKKSSVLLLNNLNYRQSQSLLKKDSSLFPSHVLMVSNYKSHHWLSDSFLNAASAHYLLFDSNIKIANNPPMKAINLRKAGIVTLEIKGDKTKALFYQDKAKRFWDG